MENNNELLTLEEAAKKLKVPKNWLYRRTGKSAGDARIPHIRLGKYVRFDWVQVQQWIADNGGVIEGLK